MFEAAIHSIKVTWLWSQAKKLRAAPLVCLPLFETWNPRSSVEIVFGLWKDTTTIQQKLLKTCQAVPSPNSWTSSWNMWIDVCVLESWTQLYSVETEYVWTATDSILIWVNLQWTASDFFFYCLSCRAFSNLEAKYAWKLCPDCHQMIFEISNGSTFLHLKSDLSDLQGLVFRLVS